MEWYYDISCWDNLCKYLSSEHRKKMLKPKSRTLPPLTKEIEDIKPTRGKAKTTAMSRNALAWALEGHSTKIKMALEKLFDKDPEAYINAVAKLMNYTVPKLSSSEITDNTSKRIKVDFNDDISVDELRKRLDEYNEE